MRCLIIDNYDSFTWNLAHYVEEQFGLAPYVIKNDADTWENIQKKTDISCMIVSPGPGHPQEDQDLGLSKAALLQNDIPVLGVCLGMQALAYLYGADVVRSAEPYHGRASEVIHHGEGIFDQIASPCVVARYHSLEVDSTTLPECLEPTAWVQDGTLMAIRHRHLPKWGVQFHPESIMTHTGKQMIANFKTCVEQRYPAPYPSISVPAKPPKDTVPPKSLHKYVVTHKQPLDKDAEQIFATLFAAEDYAFWLDSQNKARFSFMGAVPASQVYAYHLNPDDLDAGQAYLEELEQQIAHCKLQGAEHLPFAFSGGLVGFFTYEMKALFAGDAKYRNTYPDSCWFSVQSFIAIDHEQQQTWWVAIDATEAKAQTLLDEMCQEYANKLSRSNVSQPELQPIYIDPLTSDNSTLALQDKIRACKSHIRAGDSYELCLTERFYTTQKASAFDQYRQLRSQNPAPMGCFFKTPDMDVLSCSPERFLQVDVTGKVQAKPIKGTTKRSDDPIQDQQFAEQLAASEKDRAENMMIVDLMRHDLSQVCETGSVQVTQLHEIESFQTVHQLVSTVEGQLSADMTLFDLLQTTFPAGSITGAPKVRSMALLDALEHTPRGVYCGAIGYLSYNRCSDLNVAIRTNVMTQGKCTLGAGGAMTYLSAVEQEVDEIHLKVSAMTQTPASHIL